VIDRGKIVVGLLALLAIASAIGFGLMFMRLGQDCMSGSDGASCPALADVNGMRYEVSGARGVTVTAAQLEAYKPITRSNVPGHFTELTTFRVADIAPEAILFAPATHVSDEDDSPYRILWGPEKEAAYPGICGYLAEAETRIMDGCGGVAPE
jgi:hypothetical protein